MIKCGGKMAYSDFVKLLEENSDEEYRRFSAGLTPNMGESAGIRIPLLKKFAKEEAKGDWERFLAECPERLHEEKIVKGLIICYIKEPMEKKIALMIDFIRLIDNWGVCDIVCCAFKFKKNESQEVYDFVKGYIQSEGEYEKRFAIVMLLAHFIDEKHIDEILKMLNNIDDEKFYVSMACAWALSVCFVKFEDKTYDAIKEGKLSKETVNRTVTKIIQSRRVDERAKEKAKELRKK